MYSVTYRGQPEIDVWHVNMGGLHNYHTIASAPCHLLCLSRSNNISCNEIYVGSMMDSIPTTPYHTFDVH